MIDMLIVAETYWLFFSQLAVFSLLLVSNGKRLSTYLLIFVGLCLLNASWLLISEWALTIEGHSWIADRETRALVARGILALAWTILLYGVGRKRLE